VPRLPAAGSADSGSPFWFGGWNSFAGQVNKFLKLRKDLLFYGISGIFIDFSSSSGIFEVIPP
jgi:hypothetical protein